MMKPRLYEEGVEEYPKSIIVLGNVMMISWIILGGFAIWFFHPMIAWIYLVFAFLMVYVALRKMICPNCYYYDKWCSIGWGKLSAAFFRKGELNRFNEGVGIKIAPVVYGLLTLLPIVFLGITTFQKVTFPKIVVIAGILLISFYSGGIARKKNCSKCKMRLFCKGSAVK